MWQGKVARRVSEEAKPYRALMAAVIRQAIMDNDREWLGEEQCGVYCDAIGVDQNVAMDAKAHKNKGHPGKGRP